MVFINTMQLKYFVRACDEGSISKASQELYISKQGLSRSIQSLEEELGQPLLIRTLNGIQLTPAGQITYQHAKQILSSHSAMLHALDRDRAALSRRLRVAFPHGFFACVPIDLLFSFFARNPEIKCEQYCFTDVDMRKKFLEKDIDLALCSGPKDDTIFDHIILFRNRRCLYVNEGHPFARRGRVGVQDLKGELIGVPGEGYFDAPFLLEQCRKYGFEPQLFLGEGLDLLTQFAQTGQGISLIVDNLDASSIPENLRVVYFDDEETFSYDVYILTEKGNRNPDVQKFVEHARRYCGRLLAQAD